MTDWYKHDLTTLAFIWHLDRSDGVAIGFTSHDRDIVRDGFRYRAAPGMLPSAIRLSDGFDADDVDLAGALTSAAISEDDLAAGRWDAAALTLSVVDWTDGAIDAVVLVRGSFGSVAWKDGRFSVGLRGAATLFERGVSEETSPACRAALGDPRCRVDLAGRRRRVIATSIAGSVVTLAAPPADDGAHDFGTLRWIDGSNAGLSGRILRSVGAAVTLAEPPPVAPAFPVSVELLEGCDRRLETCASRFGNAINFRGEPHLPGSDALTRYA